MSFEDIIRQIVQEENAKHLEQIKKLVQPKHHDLPATLKPQEAAKVLRIGKDNMYQLLHRPGFPAIKYSEGRYIVSTSALFDWLDNNPEFKKKADLKGVS